MKEHLEQKKKLGVEFSTIEYDILKLVEYLENHTHNNYQFDLDLINAWISQYDLKILSQKETDNKR